MRSWAVRSRLLQVSPGLQAVLGAVCVVVGIVLTLRPFTSLTVLVVLVVVAALATGIAELASADDSGERGWATVRGVGWIVVGVLAAAWAGITILALAVIVGVWMVVSGVTRLAQALHGQFDARIAHAAAGLSSVIFGLLALSWPDVTVLVIAVVFGARTVIFGVSQLAGAYARSRGHDRRSSSPGFVRRSVRVVASLLALVLAIALAGVSAKLHEGSPTIDAFYRAPSTLPSQPGVLIRSDSFTHGVPADARAWRILYTTRRDNGAATVASAIVLEGSSVPPGPRPVIAWAHGTTGFAEKCAPTLLKDPFGAGAMPALSQVIANGWVLVATDYLGLGTKGPHPYLIGPGQAHSVLDAVRATRQLHQVSIENRVVVWGHSQGGNAALWTGGLATSYAPDVNLVGVAALAPASDLRGLVSSLGKVTGGSIFGSFVVEAYTRIYPDVSFNKYIAPPAQVFIRKMATRCLAEPQVLVSIVSSLALKGPMFRVDPTTGAFGKRLAQNTPTAHVAAPLFVGQGLADALVVPSVQAAYVKGLCDAGQALEYRTYAGKDHVGVVGNDSPLIPDLLQWTKDRFAGRPATSNCS